MSRGPVLIKDRRMAILLGVAAITGGAFLLYDAYERRGARRPFALKFLPGA